MKFNKFQRRILRLTDLTNFNTMKNNIPTKTTNPTMSNNINKFSKLEF